jgi:hypothetical protein
MGLPVEKEEMRSIACGSMKRVVAGMEGRRDSFFPARVICVNSGVETTE